MVIMLSRDKKSRKCRREADVDVSGDTDDDDEEEEVDIDNNYDNIAFPGQEKPEGAEEKREE